MKIHPMLLTQKMYLKRIKLWIKINVSVTFGYITADILFSLWLKPWFYLGLSSLYK